MSPFTLFNEHSCNVRGCEREAKVFGFCREHYNETIQRKSLQIRGADKDKVRPPCFTEQEWLEYEVMCHEAGTNASDYCRDCLPDFKERMVAQQRCAHPETIFVRQRDGVAGFCIGRLDVYMQASSGQLGKVVHNIPAAERLKYIEGAQ